MSAGLCDICNLVVTFVKPYVDSNATQVGVSVSGVLCSPAVRVPSPEGGG